MDNGVSQELKDFYDKKVSGAELAKALDQVGMLTQAFKPEGDGDKFREALNNINKTLDTMKRAMYEVLVHHGASPDMVIRSFEVVEKLAHIAGGIGYSDFVVTETMSRLESE